MDAPFLAIYVEDGLLWLNNLDNKSNHLGEELFNIIGTGKPLMIIAT